MYFETGSSSRSLPSSTSRITATEVIGFVIEKMRNTASVVIGAPCAGSRVPADAEYASLPCRATATITPATFPESTQLLSIGEMASSAVLESPTACGLARGIPCARAPGWASADKRVAPQQAMARSERRTRDIMLGLRLFHFLDHVHRV